MEVTMQSKKSIRIWECHTCGSARSCAVVGEMYTKRFKATCHICDPALYKNVSEEQKNKWLKGGAI